MYIYTSSLFAAVGRHHNHHHVHILEIWSPTQPPAIDCARRCPKSKHPTHTPLHIYVAQSSFIQLKKNHRQKSSTKHSARPHIIASNILHIYISQRACGLFYNNCARDHANMRETHKCALCVLEVCKYMCIYSKFKANAIYIYTYIRVYIQIFAKCVSLLPGGLENLRLRCFFARRYMSALY